MMRTTTKRGSVLRTSPTLRSQVETKIRQQIDEVIQNTKHGKNTRKNPFYAGLPKRMLRASRIERSISAGAGTLYQAIAAEIAVGAGYRAVTEFEVKGEMTPSVLNYISTATAKNKTSTPNIKRENNTLKKRTSEGNGQAQEATVDLFININGIEHYFDMKTPQPTPEQCRSIKGRLLEVKALNLPLEVVAFAVFPFNPDPKKSHRVGIKYLDYDGGATVAKSTKIVDIIFSKDLFGSILNLSISNLLNEKYERPLTYTKDGRRLTIGLRKSY